MEDDAGRILNGSLKEVELVLQGTEESHGVLRGHQGNMFVGEALAFVGSKDSELEK